MLLLDGSIDRAASQRHMPPKTPILTLSDPKVDIGSSQMLAKWYKHQQSFANDGAEALINNGSTINRPSKSSTISRFGAKLDDISPDDPGRRHTGLLVRLRNQPDFFVVESDRLGDGRMQLRSMSPHHGAANVSARCITYVSIDTS